MTRFGLRLIHSVFLPFLIAAVSVSFASHADASLDTGLTHFDQLYQTELGGVVSCQSQTESRASAPEKSNNPFTSPGCSRMYSADNAPPVEKPPKYNCSPNSGARAIISCTLLRQRAANSGSCISRSASFLPCPGKSATKTLWPCLCIACATVVRKKGESLRP